MIIYVDLRGNDLLKGQCNFLDLVEGSFPSPLCMRNRSAKYSHGLWLTVS